MEERDWDVSRRCAGGEGFIHFLESERQLSTLESQRSSSCQHSNAEQTLELGS